MKKLILFFILLLSFTSIKSANAQLEFYQFMLNIYDNGERTIDTNKFKVSIESFDGREPTKRVLFKNIQPGDSAKQMGYDYDFLTTELLFDFIVKIHIAKGKDTMTIVFDNPNAGAWEAIGMDKVEFQKGVFRFTEKDWPKNRRDRPNDNRYFPFIDENFNWQKIKQ